MRSRSMPKPGKNFGLSTPEPASSLRRLVSPSTEDNLLPLPPEEAHPSTAKSQTSGPKPRIACRRPPRRSLFLHCLRRATRSARTVDLDSLRKKSLCRHSVHGERSRECTPKEGFLGTKRASE